TAAMTSSRPSAAAMPRRSPSKPPDSTDRSPVFADLKAGLRGYRDSLAIGYRSAPRAVTAQFALALLQAVLMPLIVYCTKLLVDGVQRGEARTAYLAALGIAVGVAVVWGNLFVYLKLVFGILDHAHRAADRELMVLM